MKPWTEQDFLTNVGRPAEKDDLERVNCQQVGQRGHNACGVCLHNLPVFECQPCFVNSMSRYFKRLSVTDEP